MSVFRPSVEEERWLSLRDALGDSIVARTLTNGWTRTALLPRIAFFILGAIACAAVAGLIHALMPRQYIASLLAGAIAIGAAELLLTQKRLWGYGFEEALWAGGCACIAHAFAYGNEAVFVSAFATALTAAAARLSNGFFASLAVAWWLTWTHELRHLEVGAFACSLLAVACWLVVAKHFRSPSTQRVIEWLAVVCPIAAYIAAVTAYVPRLAFALVIGIAISITLVIRLRERALLYAAAACGVLLAYELRHLTSLSLEAKLIVYGAALLTGAVIAERELRRTRGVTSLPLGRDSEAWRLVELGATAALATSRHTPHEEPQRSGPEFESGPGSSYGGGGAGGTF